VEPCITILACENDRKGEEVTAKKILLTAATLGFCLILSFFLPADVAATWGFSMGENGDYPAGNQHANFSKIEFFIADVPQNSGVTWSGSGVSNFSNTSWGSDKINPTYILATGPAVTGDLFWDFLFSGTAPKKNFRLDYLVYTSNNSPAFGISMSIDKGVPRFNPSGWTALNLNNLPNYNRSPVAAPVPPSAFLLGTGLIGVIALRKRIHG
jgi:hypothetical protein